MTKKQTKLIEEAGKLAPVNPPEMKDMTAFEYVEAVHELKRRADLVLKLWSLRRKKPTKKIEAETEQIERELLTEGTGKQEVVLRLCRNMGSSLRISDLWDKEIDGKPYRVIGMADVKLTKKGRELLKKR